MVFWFPWTPWPARVMPIFRQFFFVKVSPKNGGQSLKKPNLILFWIPATERRADRHPTWLVRRVGSGRVSGPPAGPGPPAGSRQPHNLKHAQHHEAGQEPTAAEILVNGQFGWFWPSLADFIALATFYQFFLATLARLANSLGNV